MDYAPFPLIELSGGAHERGLQHGRAVPDRIGRGIKMYADSLLKNGVDWPELERRATALVPARRSMPPMSRSCGGSRRARVHPLPALCC